MRKPLCTLLVAMTVLACVTAGASASSPIPSTELDQGVVLNRGVPIGTPADEDGILLEGIGPRSSGLPFTMTAKGVTGLLTTYSSSGKNFTGGAFDGFNNEGLLIKGTITHTQGKSTKVGACYYQASNNTFYSVDSKQFSSGKSNSLFIPKISGGVLYFNNSMTYYGHITNNSGGSASGSLDFSVSTG